MRAGGCCRQRYLTGVRYARGELDRCRQRCLELEAEVARLTTAHQQDANTIQELLDTIEYDLR